MISDDLIAFTRLHQLTLPVNVVQWDLHELHLGMLRQDAVQQLRGGMERKAKMLDIPARKPLVRVVEQTTGLDHAALSVHAVVIDGLEVVKQIIVNIVHAEVLQLLGEDRFNLILFLQRERRELGCHCEAVAGMALHNGFAGCFLTFAVVVDVAGVEVRVPCPKKCVHHLKKLWVIEICGVAVFHRQAHHAETKGTL